MLGIFPMSDSRTNKKIFFVDPKFRAIIPISNFRISKSLLRLIKKKPFEVTMNRAFPDVIKSCATINRTETWINKEIESLFISLHENKYAHSIECWQKKKISWWNIWVSNRRGFFCRINVQQCFKWKQIGFVKPCSKIVENWI